MFTMLCYFHCTTCESAVHISPPSWTSLLPDHPTPLGHHRAPSWAPHAIEQLPTSIYFTHGKKTLLFNSTKCYHDVFQSFPPRPEENILIPKQNAVVSLWGPGKIYQVAMGWEEPLVHRGTWTPGFPEPKQPRSTWT